MIEQSNFIRGYLTLLLYRAPEKGDDRAYIIPNNVSNINQVGEIVCDPNHPRTTVIVNLPENITILRRKVVDRNYGGIENLVEKVKSGKVKLRGD
jgi:hypothetical protein